MIDDMVYNIAMDEIRHASLAWITIKWMMDNSHNTQIQCRSATKIGGINN